MTNAVSSSTPPHTSIDPAQSKAEIWKKMAAEHGANLKANGIEPSKGMQFFCTFKDGKYDKRLRGIPNAVVGDLATGSGKDTFVLDTRYPNIKKITAIDTNEDVMKALKQNLDDRNLVSMPEKIELVTGKLKDAQLAKESHDFFIVHNGFPNFDSKEEIQETLKDLASCLKPNGFLCVNFFRPDHEFAKTNPEMHFHSETEIEKLCETAGLVIEECEPQGEKDRKISMGRTVDWSEFQVIAYKPDTTSKYAETSSAGDRLRQHLNT